MKSVAFCSFRLKTQDGVSVEAEKRIGILGKWGFKTNRIAGYVPNPSENDYVIPELNPLDPRIEAFTEAAFGGGGSGRLLDELEQLTEAVSTRLDPLLDELGLDLLIGENVFSVPLNIPFTIALERYIERRDLACIAIHHESIWQNPAHKKCIRRELLGEHFPARSDSIMHVVTSKLHRREFRERTGLTASCWHNCFDFEATRGPDEFNAPLRKDLGIGCQEVMLLQPTLAIERKSIGQSIRFAEDLAEASGRKATLVVTGPCEEGYDSRFESLCRDSSVRVIHVPNWAGSVRDDPAAGSPYDIHDLYARCDMVTFPSSREGFGNPVLESVVHRKPLLVAEYPVLEELRGFGFQFLALDEGAVDRAIKLMDRPQLLDEMLDRNYVIGRKNFSLAVLEEQMRAAIDQFVAVSS